MYFVITYKEYCEAMGETYEGTTPNWFYRIQHQAIETIRKEIVDVLIFPKNSAMLHNLKPQWMPMVIQGISRQIFYTYNNEYFLNNGAFANRSYSQTQYGEGPVNEAAYQNAIGMVCTPALNSFLGTGWLCKKMGVKFDKDKYYVKYAPSYKDVNWGQIGGNIIDQLDLIDYLADHYVVFNDFFEFKNTTIHNFESVDANIAVLTEAIGSKQDNLKGLATYAANRTLVTDAEGNVIWGEGIGASEWGKISGTISNQKDLQEALDKKQAKVFYGSFPLGYTPVDNDILVTKASEGEGQYLKTIAKDATNKIITIKDQDDVETSFPYGASSTQKQSDWAQTDSTAVDFIKNKPDLSVYAKEDDLEKEVTNRQDAVSQCLADAKTYANTSVSTEKARAEAAEGTISSNLSNEVSNRQSADTTLNTAITTEASNRQSADNTLQSNINTVSSNLTTEIANRGSADTALGGRIDTVDAKFSSYLPLGGGTMSGNLNMSKNQINMSGGAIKNVAAASDDDAVPLKYIKNNFILQSAPDGTTIKYDSGVLKAIIPAVMTLKGQKTSVSDLPTGAADGDVWFVKPSGATSSEMYVWIAASSAWVNVGSTTIDLSAYETTSHASSTYATISNLNTVSSQVTTNTDNIAKKQDKLSTEQLTAVNSGITASLVTGLDSHLVDTDIHVTAKEKADWTALETSKQDTITDLADIRSGAEKGAKSIQLLTVEPGSKQPYNFATHFTFTPDANQINGLIYTVTLDNNQTAKTWPVTIPGATTSTAGLMNASDKTKLDSITPSDLATKAEVNAKLDATKCTYSTTAPTTAITDGGVHIVYLETEPTTKYDGYIYFIK